ncbi:hypothetical protein [Asanoa iriomotensis]|uniref:Uncharacterized protein n=1 Tax=Asanoa iriomotensis TaxID=234613 RepID=A0ABQ4C888_9ACTN|nr:hypothetical protein [Asanoa iriomotensis]GIF58959.1 hypothetical protein Air01nite_50540 [Asanoa iriomotensis]
MDFRESVPNAFQARVPTDYVSFMGSWVSGSRREVRIPKVRLLPEGDPLGRSDQQGGPRLPARRQRNACEIAEAMNKRLKKRPAAEDRNHRNVGFPGLGPGASMLHLS